MKRQTYSGEAWALHFVIVNTHARHTHMKRKVCRFSNIVA
jgi:hypothetical protein